VNRGLQNNNYFSSPQCAGNADAILLQLKGGCVWLKGVVRHWKK
jgi:hypothetical protein